MTEVLHSPSPSSSPSISNATLLQDDVLTIGDVVEEEQNREKRESDRREQLSLLALLVALFRKSFWLNCKTDRDDYSGASTSDGMEIGWPTDVEHVNHVTFDRFDGFLGLPVEFEPEVPRRAPSASATVFGVSTESMQLSHDSRGNSIPTILLLMQKHLYNRGGLQAEGIFRITAGNSQEEYVREQLNRGIVPDGIDVHCLGGLIKAWFRELPSGVLDSLSPEQVMQCQSEEDCDALVRLLPPTEAALLNWAINLMADVVQEEHMNKMNARNIAMVFAPNMTQMADPLTALMYAVQVMNFLKTLIEKTLREREDPVLEPSPVFDTGPSDDRAHRTSSRLSMGAHQNVNEVTVITFHLDDPHSESASETNRVNNVPDEDDASFYSTSAEESDASVISRTPELSSGSSIREAEVTKGLQSLRQSSDPNSPTFGPIHNGKQDKGSAQKIDSTREAEVMKGFQSQRRSSDPNWPTFGLSNNGKQDKGSAPKIDSTREAEVVKGFQSQRRSSDPPNWPTFEPITNGKQDKGSAAKIDSKNKGISNLAHINSMTERYEAWR